jgi:hypothetical protein
MIRDSSIRHRDLRIAAKACCMPPIERVPAKSVVDLKDSRAFHRQSRYGPVIGILCVHLRISHKFEKMGSSIYTTGRCMAFRLRFRPVW